MIYPEKKIIRKDSMVFVKKIGKYRDEVVEKSSKIGMNFFRICQEKSADLFRSLPKKVADICRFFFSGGPRSRWQIFAKNDTFLLG